MAAMARHAPMNFQHKHDLVEAERARVEGRPHDALEGYEKAIRGAHAAGFVQEEALAYELAGELYLALDRQRSPSSTSPRPITNTRAGRRPPRPSSSASPTRTWSPRRSTSPTRRARARRSRATAPR